MLTLNLENDEFIINLHSFGEGVRCYSVYNKATTESFSEVEYDDDTQTADENVVIDASLLIDQGWRLG